jgi:hypothetical protein
MVITLSESQKRDLLHVYSNYVNNSADYPNGRADSLKCGTTLERLGLVKWDNQYTANRFKRWSITENGIDLSKELFKDIQVENKPIYNRHIVFKKGDNSLEVCFADDHTALITKNGFNKLSVCNVEWVHNKVCGEGFQLYYDSCLEEAILNINRMPMDIINPIEMVKSYLPSDYRISSGIQIDGRKVYQVTNSYNAPVMTVSIEKVVNVVVSRYDTEAIIAPGIFPYKLPLPEINDGVSGMIAAAKDKAVKQEQNKPDKVDKTNNIER